MPLDDRTQHILLEKQNTNQNSFIANINEVANNLDAVKRFNETYNEDTINAFTELGSTVINDMPLYESLAAIAVDLKKGHINGNRKIDIDVLTNFTDYHNSMSPEEQDALYRTDNAKVYYGAMTITLDNGLTKKIMFERPCWTATELFVILRDHIKSYYQTDASGNILIDTRPTVDGKPNPDFNEYILKDEYASNKNQFMILRTEVAEVTLNDYFTNVSFDRIVLRVYDRFVEDNTKKGSNIATITLHNATNAQYAGVQTPLAKSTGKTPNPAFSWMDTTSSLYTIADNIASIEYAANYIEAVGDSLVDNLEAARQELDEGLQTTKLYSEVAKEASEQASSKADSIFTLNVTSRDIDAYSNPTVTYVPASNRLEFNLPKSKPANLDLSSFEIDGNGHLILRVGSAS